MTFSIVARSADGESWGVAVASKFLAAGSAVPAAVTGDGYAIQGNILAGEDVVLAMEAAWETTDDDAPLGRRLLAALTAGDDAGGDSRGRQSAALLVVREGAGYGGHDDVAVDLRVDDHADPVT